MPLIKKVLTLHPNTWAVLMGVRLALYAEVAARCCWSWATGYLAQLLKFRRNSFPGRLYGLMARVDPLVKS